MFKKLQQSFNLGQQIITLEHGEIGRQAAATVIVNVDDTVVLVSVTANPEAKSGANFLPLSVDYQEKFYAAGRVPGGFFRREGRPTEKEILTSRLIDRSLRPLFPSFFYNEVQVVANVLSYNPNVAPDIPAMIGASAAMKISGIPFAGPIGAARVGYIDGQVVVAPTEEQMKKSALNLVVAGTKEGVLMVESEAGELPEETMLSAVMMGHQEMQTTIAAIEQLATAIANPAWQWQAPTLPEDVQQKLAEVAKPRFENAYNIRDKQERSRELDVIRNDSLAAVSTDDAVPVDENLINSSLKKIEAGIVRNRILDGQPRIDGRATDTVRDIAIRLGVLPRTHGSALFTRGETQALVIATMGSEKDDQKIDGLDGMEYDAFMMHYNFPPFATGETGRVGSPKRREIGHGYLAKRGMAAAMPSRDSFNFAIRVVSEITESNGSSSMASTCGASLALMDAGIPIKTSISGIAMGLIKEGDKYSILSDILGDEDHLGDMDFKVAGSKNGITALQMDLKITSIDENIMRAALAQAKAGRLHILSIMDQHIAEPRPEMSPYAPSVLKMTIPVNKIREVIGKGGSVIRSITESTGAQINIDDDGTITINGVSKEVCRHAQEKIEEITVDLEIGKIYEGKVENILDKVGAIVTIMPGRDGLLHISQIADERVTKITDYLNIGQSVRVKVIRSDEGKVRLTMLNLDGNSE